MRNIATGSFDAVWDRELLRKLSDAIRKEVRRRWGVSLQGQSKVTSGVGKISFMYYEWISFLVGLDGSITATSSYGLIRSYVDAFNRALSGLILSEDSIGEIVNIVCDVWEEYISAWKKRNASRVSSTRKVVAKLLDAAADLTSDEIGRA